MTAVHSLTTVPADVESVGDAEKYPGLQTVHSRSVVVVESEE